MSGATVKIKQSTLNGMAASVSGLLKTVYSPIIHDKVSSMVQNSGSTAKNAEKIAKYAVKGWERALEFAYETYANKPNVVNFFVLWAVFYQKEKEFTTFLADEVADAIKNNLTKQEEVLLHFANAFFTRYPIYLEIEEIRKKSKGGAS